jgi:hypothetical protein
MPNCPPYGCYDNWAELADLEACPGTAPGGINAAILFKCGVSREDLMEDLNPDTLDEAKIEALLASGDAKLITRVQITINAPSTLNAPSGDPCVGEAAINYDRSLTWQDYNVNRSRQLFYDSINAVKGFPIGGVLLRHCATDMTSLILSDLRFNGGRQSPEQATEAQLFQFDVTYRSVNDPEIPEGTVDVF